MPKTVNKESHSGEPISFFRDCTGDIAAPDFGAEGGGVRTNVPQRRFRGANSGYGDVERGAGSDLRGASLERTTIFLFCYHY